MRRRGGRGSRAARFVSHSDARTVFALADSETFDADRAGSNRSCERSCEELFCIADERLFGGERVVHRVFK